MTGMSSMLLRQKDNYGTIENGSSYIGGVVARIEGTTKIINCENNVNINSDSSYIGGIVGQAINGEFIIANCKNNGNIISSGQSCGGIAGDVGNQIEVQTTIKEKLTNLLEAKVNE